MAGQKRCNGEGSIRKRVRQGKTYWEGRYTNEEGKQKSVSAKTQKECREKLREAIDEAEQKKKIVPNSSGYDPLMTLNEWADICFKLLKNNVKETTIYIDKLWAYDTIIAPKLGNIPLNKLGKNDVLNFIQSMTDDYAHNSIETVARVIKNLLNIAVREDVIEESVAKDIIAIGGRGSKQKRELTQEEIDIFLEYAGNRREDNILAFHIMLNTGMRCGEVLALTWKDIDKDYTYIDVNKTVNGLGKITQPKTKDSIRKVPINPFLKSELKRRYELTLERANGLSNFNICNEYIITSKKGTRNRDTQKFQEWCISMYG